MWDVCLSVCLSPGREVTAVINAAAEKLLSKGVPAVDHALFPDGGACDIIECPLSRRTEELLFATSRLALLHSHHVATDQKTTAHVVILL
jgi:hypothetical protein